MSREVSGVTCDKMVSARTKGKVYKIVVKPGKLHGLGAMTLTKRQKAELRDFGRGEGRRKAGEKSIMRRFMGMVREDISVVGIRRKRRGQGGMGKRDSLKQLLKEPKKTICQNRTSYRFYTARHPCNII